VTTAYRAPWIIAFQDGEHRLLRDGVVVVSGDTVINVGPTLEDEVDRVVDLPETLVTPGFISTHAHLHSSPVDKSVQEDVGNRQFWLTGLIEVLPLEMAGLDDAAKRLCVDYSLPELVRGGVTTVMEIGDTGEYVAEAAEHAGLRCYVAETYRSARWYTPDGRRVDYDWDEAAGERAFKRAVQLIERVDQGDQGLVRGFLAPAQVDTCSAQLLRDTAQAAEDLSVPVSIHAAQGVWEFNEMTRRHGLTPIEWLHSLGLPVIASDHRSRHLHDRTQLGELRRRRRGPAGRDRHRRGVQLLVLREAWVRDGVLSALRRRRSADVPGHGHRAAVDDRRYALDRSHWEDRLPTV
jgi:5-methylthioadenosine/S-adenosylhomocysteine deaminase